MSADTIEKLFIEELKDLYSAETQITKALPKLAEAATSSELKSALEHHLKETEGHVRRLEQAFEILGGSPRGKACEGMKGLLSEGSDSMKEAEKGNVRDAALIGGAQRVEHYEIAAYGTVHGFAERLNQKEIAQLLAETLDEEKAADKKLTEISKKVNQQAARAA